MNSEFYLEEVIPECCKGCSNHPSNGGSGICHCTLPYFESQKSTKPTIATTETTTTWSVAPVPDPTEICESDFTETRETEFFFYLATMEKLIEDKEIEKLEGEITFPNFGKVTLWGVFRTRAEAEKALMRSHWWYPYDYAVIEVAELGLMPIAESRQLYQKSKKGWKKIKEPDFVKGLDSIVFG